MLDDSSMMFPETAHFSGRVVHFVNAFKEPDVFLVQVSIEMAKQIVDAFQDLTEKETFTGQEFKDLIDQYDDRTKYINPLNNLIWQIN